MDKVRIFGSDGELTKQYQDICKVAGIEPVGWIGSYFCGVESWMAGGVPDLSVLKKGDLHSAESARLFWQDVVSSLCLSKEVVLAQATNVFDLESKLANSWIYGSSSGVRVFRYSDYDANLHLCPEFRKYSAFLFSSDADSFRWILNYFNGDQAGNFDVSAASLNISGSEFGGFQNSRFWIDVLDSLRISPLHIAANGYDDAVRSGRSIVEYRSRCEQVLKAFTEYSWSDVENLLKN